MGREIIIRNFEPEDAEAVSFVIRQTMRVSNSSDYSWEQLEPLIEYFSAEKVLLLNKERHCIVAEINNKIVGTVAVENSELVTFFVLPEYQRTGIGMELLQAIEKIAVENKINLLKAEASITGTPFYENFGYRRTGFVKDGTAGKQIELVKQLTIIILSFLICASTVLAQTENRQLNSDPEKAEFVMSDIDNFWRAFDLAGKETTREKKIAVYQKEYLDKGSVGLQDFLRMRIKSAENLYNTVEKLPNFYASARQSTLRVRAMEKRMRKSFRKFKQIYPDALFPDVYFVIGITSTGGTASANGLLIGTELYGLTDKTPRDEFVELFKKFMPNVKDETEIRSMADKFTNVALKPVEGIPAIVAHESCHFNQKYSALDSLLAKVLQEGACDFIGEKISGELMNPAQKTYGEKHEAELWREFQTEINGKNEKNWMYNALTAKTRPPDLGYFIGYKISQSYYKNADDRQQAIRDILQIKDFPAFLRQSMYRQQKSVSKR